MKARTQAMVLTILALCAFSCLAIGTQEYYPTNDWRSSQAGSQHIDAASLQAIDAYVKERIPKTSSIIVIRHGYIVFERYYSGGPSDIRSLYSETKSVLSALIGIAIKQGYIKDLNQKMIDFFPERVNEKMNVQANEVQLRHLLTMSDGMNGSYFRDDTLSSPFRADPGKELFYNPMSPQVMSIIISKLTGMKAFEYGKKNLFEPLGIKNIIWSDFGDSGYSDGAQGMLLSSRDMAKIGYLYLKKGKWGDKEILSSDWVTESTRSHIIGTTATHPVPLGYGYYWWVTPLASHDSFFAAGYGGQSIAVIPDLDIVTVITTGESNDKGSEKYLKVIEDCIIPSIKD